MKKKTNPNKIPLANNQFDPKSVTGQISDNVTFLAWLEVFGALADFLYVTQEGIWDLWHRANKAAGAVHRYDDIETWIQKTENLADIRLPYHKLSSANIHTQGDLDRFIRKTERNALSSAYAIIARALIDNEFLPTEDIQRIFQKADALNGEINERRITVVDIQTVLKDELDLQLSITSTGVKLVKGV